jgi:hypothetical protein
LIHGWDFDSELLYISDAQRDIVIATNILGVHNIIDASAYKTSWKIAAKAFGAMALLFGKGAVVAYTIARKMDRMIGENRMSRRTGLFLVIPLGLFVVGSCILSVLWAIELQRPPTPPF